VKRGAGRRVVHHEDEPSGMVTVKDLEADTDSPQFVRAFPDWTERMQLTARSARLR
jgi:hypothetical protein